jgi:regulator of replication initiation timing
MSDKIIPLEERIAKFESLLEEMKEATRECHETLKSIKLERKEIENLLASRELRSMVNDKVSEAVKAELDAVGPQIRKLTEDLYDRVGTEVDKLIDICLGKEFSVSKGREDLRPELAVKLREWLREIIYT